MRNRLWAVLGGGVAGAAFLMMLGTTLEEHVALNSTAQIVVADGATTLVDGGSNVDFGQTALGDGKLDSTLTVTRSAAASFDSAMVSLQATTEEARVILGGLREGEGTVGRLLTDETLYDRADSTLQSLDRLLDQMRRNPKAMFKMSVF